MEEISCVKYIDVFHEIGWDAAAKLQKEFHGGNLYVGKKKDAEPFRRMVAVIGEEKAERMRVELGGTTFPYPPQAFSRIGPRRGAERTEIKRMYKSGIAVGDLAISYRRSLEVIEKIVGLREWEPADKKGRYM